MKNFKLITFDCYGTLIDWEGGMREALRKLQQHKKIEMDIVHLQEKYIEIEAKLEKEKYRKYREILELGIKKTFDEAKIELKEGEERIFSNTIVEWKPFSEVKEVLTKLKDKFKIVILSNIDEDIIKYSIKLIKVEFDGVITAERVKSYKPAPKHWETALKTFKLKKEDVLHVAASYYHDIVPAKKLGFTTVWINRKKQKASGSAKPDYEFENLKPLTSLLLT
jgi:2-haloacid dehalogenase